MSKLTMPYEQQHWNQEDIGAAAILPASKIPNIISFPRSQANCLLKELSILHLSTRHNLLKIDQIIQTSIPNLISSLSTESHSFLQ